MKVDKYAIQLVTLKEEMMRAGYVKTAHALEEAVKAVGYEIAEMRVRQAKTTSGRKLSIQGVKLGATVEWTSQSGGFTKTKQGMVAQIVPAGSYPDRDRFSHLYKSAGVGMRRNHESYVVMVGNRPYWPRANQLEISEE